MLTFCDSLRVPVVAEKLALDWPAAIVTEAGTLKAAFELLSEIVAALAAA